MAWGHPCPVANQSARGNCDEHASSAGVALFDILTTFATEAQSAVANKEAFRLAPTAPDVKAYNCFCAPGLSFSRSDGSVEDKAAFIANAPSAECNSPSPAAGTAELRVTGTAAISRLNRADTSQSLGRREDGLGQSPS
jgi:hypothetical protein